jgi:hypothetical protein
VRRAGEVPGGYIYVDGLGVGDIGEVVLRDRHHLASDGFVVVVVAINRQTAELAREIEALARGFVFLPEAGELVEEIRTYVTGLVAEAAPHGPGRPHPQRPGRSLEPADQAAADGAADGDRGPSAHHDGGGVIRAPGGVAVGTTTGASTWTWGRSIRPPGLSCRRSLRWLNAGRMARELGAGCGRSG